MTSSPAGSIRIGVSGWRYPPWRGAFRWSRRIRQWSGGKEPGDARRISPERPRSGTARDVFCYFDNTANDEAPRNAIQLSDKLGVTPGRGADWSAAGSAHRSRR